MKLIIALVLILILLTLIGAEAQCTDAELAQMGLTSKPWPRTHIWAIQDGCTITPAYKDSVEGIVIKDWSRAIKVLNSGTFDSTRTHLMLELLLFRVEASKNWDSHPASFIWNDKQAPPPYNWVNQDWVKGWTISISDPLSVIKNP